MASPNLDLLEVVGQKQKISPQMVVNNGDLPWYTLHFKPLGRFVRAFQGSAIELRRCEREAPFHRCTWTAFSDPFPIAFVLTFAASLVEPSPDSITLPEDAQWLGTVQGSIAWYCWWTKTDKLIDMVTLSLEDILGHGGWATTRPTGYGVAGPGTGFGVKPP